MASGHQTPWRHLRRVLYFIGPLRLIMEIVSCEICGLTQSIEPLPPGASAQCARCGFALYKRKPHSLSRTGAFALAALILYVPANLYPLVTTEYWGAQEKTTIFDAIQGLFQTGEYAIGLLVFTTSLFTPVLKIIGLILLVLTIHWGKWPRFRTWVYRIILFVDPWNMLEVYLLAVVVSIAELGRVATVHPGAGVISFAGFVVCTILAAISFDPRLIWDHAEEAHATK
jgi:paraquat-inducible protein A